MRLGIQTAAGTNWLNNAQFIVTRYRPGQLIYEIHDSLLGTNALNLTAVPLANQKGLIVRADTSANGIDLIWAFGGANGMRGSRGGDIGSRTRAGRGIFPIAARTMQKCNLAIGKLVFRGRR